MGGIFVLRLGPAEGKLWHNSNRIWGIRTTETSKEFKARGFWVCWPKPAVYEFRDQH